MDIKINLKENNNIDIVKLQKWHFYIMPLKKDGK